MGTLWSPGPQYSIIHSISLGSSPFIHSGRMEWCAGRCSVWPYPGITNYDIPQYVVSGERLKRPSLCPQDL